MILGSAYHFLHFPDASELSRKYIVRNVESPSIPIQCQY